MSESPYKQKDGILNTSGNVVNFTPTYSKFMEPTSCNSLNSNSDNKLGNRNLKQQNSGQKSDFSNNNKNNTAEEIKQLNTLISLRQTVSHLPRDFFMKLLGLEERILLDENYTRDTITDIVEQYAKAVEHYDSLKDPIAQYFLEKIQMTLSSQDALEIMHEKKRKLRESITKFESLSQGQFQKMNLQDLEDNFDSFGGGGGGSAKQGNSSTIFNPSQFGQNDFASMKNKYKTALKNKNENKDLRYSISKKKKERAKKVEIYQEQQKHYEQNDMKVLYKQYEKVSEKNKETVETQLNNQDDIIQQRLKLRKYQKNLNSSRKKNQESEGDTLQTEENEEEQFQNEEIRYAVNEKKLSPQEQQISEFDTQQSQNTDQGLENNKNNSSKINIRDNSIENTEQRQSQNEEQNIDLFKSTVEIIQDMGDRNINRKNINQQLSVIENNTEEENNKNNDNQDNMIQQNMFYNESGSQQKIQQTSHQQIDDFDNAEEESGSVRTSYIDNEQNHQNSNIVNIDNQDINSEQNINNENQHNQTDNNIETKEDEDENNQNIKGQQ